MKRVIVILILVSSACVARTPANQGVTPTAPVLMPTFTPLAQSSPIASATSRPITWEKQFDNHGNADIAWDVVETPERDLVIVGITGPTPCQIGCNWDGWIIKINPQGEIIWTRQMGGAGADLLTSVILTESGIL